MSDAASNENVAVLGDFLEFLRARDFNVSIQDYLHLEEIFSNARVRQSLANAGDDDSNYLKVLLCPLFASNKTEQHRFYEVFDEYVKFVAAPRREKSGGGDSFAPESQSPAAGKRARKPRRYSLLIASALLLGATTAIIPLVIDRAESGDDISAARAPENVNPGGSRNADEADAAGTNVRIEPQDQTPPESSTGDNNRSSSQFESGAELQQAPDLADPEINERIPGWVFLLIAGAGILLFLLYELSLLVQRHLFIRRYEKNKRPPFSWPIVKKNHSLKLYREEEFYKAARRLRQRQVGEYHRLDIDATIGATIKSGNYPTLRYKLDKKIPEYLLLIERVSFRDHQARLFDEMGKALTREGLFLERFFYNEDPRECFKQIEVCIGDSSIPLTRMRSKYGDHRLVVLGDGETMLEPISGRLAGWVKLFSGWHERAILTPESVWGLREKYLMNQFRVLPATPGGLSYLAEQFESPDMLKPKLLPPTPPPEIGPVDVTISALRTYLGADTFQWLCACALYPELHWDLTLHFGSLPSMRHAGNEENLMRLSRLTWFRHGAIPDEFRWPLINALEWGRRKEIRAALIELLEENVPPQNSFAADTHRLQLSLQRWLLSGDEDDLNKLRQVLKEIPLALIAQDKVLLRFLNGVPNSFLGLRLPNFLPKRFYKQGVRLFGLRTRARFVITLFLIALTIGFVKSDIIRLPLQKDVVLEEPQPEPPDYSDNENSNSNSLAVIPAGVKPRPARPRRNANSAPSKPIINRNAGTPEPLPTRPAPSSGATTDPSSIIADVGTPLPAGSGDSSGGGIRPGISFALGPGLDARQSTLRSMESNFGNYVADAYRLKMNTDIALVNSGSIRSNTIYAPDQITEQEIAKIFPIQNRLTKVALSGAHIKRLLEHGVSAMPQEDGRFLQVSGLLFGYDPTRAVGSRVTAVRIGGRQLDPKKIYTVATNDYLLQGGDGFNFQDADAKVMVTPDEGPFVNDAIREAFSNPNLIPREFGIRIQIDLPPGKLASANGRYVASVNAPAGTVSITDARTQKVINLKSSEINSTGQIAFNLVSYIVATANDRGTVQLWKLADGRLIRTMTGKGGKVKSVVFESQNLLRLTTVTGDYVVWDVLTGQEVERSNK